jgi:hypothetical protein
MDYPYFDMLMALLSVLVASILSLVYVSKSGRRRLTGKTEWCWIILILTLCSLPFIATLW